MSAKKLYQIILCNSIGIALFLSWYLPVDHGFWASMDRAVFFYFNQHLRKPILPIFRCVYQFPRF